MVEDVFFMDAEDLWRYVPCAYRSSSPSSIRLRRIVITMDDRVQEVAHIVRHIITQGQDGVTYGVQSKDLHGLRFPISGEEFYKYVRSDTFPDLTYQSVPYS